jgi:tetratricopeptide (TPR) repeat protein
MNGSRRPGPLGPGWPVVLALVVVSCGSTTPEAPVPAPVPLRSALQEVREPDASRVSPSVRERIRAQYASLVLTKDNAGTSDADLAISYGEMGKLLMSAELLIEAEPFFANAQTLAPTEMRWPYYRGQIARLQHASDRAIPHLERALALRPDYVPALVLLGDLLLEQGKPDDAGAAFQKAVGADANSAAGLFGLGRVALARKDPAQAIAHLEKALAVDRDATSVHYSLGMAYRARGDQKRADTHLKQWRDRQVAVDDPLMGEIGGLLRTAVDFEIRGTRALDRGNWAEAVAELRKGLAVAPRDASLHLNLGSALYLGGDEKGAYAEFEEAVRLSPGYARAHFTLGVLSESRGDDKAAVDRFTAAVTHDPTLAAARFALANALRRTGRAEASLTHYENLLAADPGASEARLGHALALVQLNRYADAVRSFREGANTYRDQPGFAHALARVLASAPDASARDGAAALSIMERLVKAGRSPEIDETMAMVMAELGRFREAAEWQREAIARARSTDRPAIADRMADNLKLYESGMPCRTPWRADDPVFTPAAAGIVR